MVVGLPRVVYVRESESEESEVSIFFIQDKEVFSGLKSIRLYSLSFTYLYESDTRVPLGLYSGRKRFTPLTLRLPNK